MAKRKKTVNSKSRGKNGRFIKESDLSKELKKDFGFDISFYKGFKKKFYELGSEIKDENENAYIFRKLKELKGLVETIQTYHFEDRHLIENIKNSKSKVYIDDIPHTKRNAIKKILSYTQQVKVGLAFFYINTDISIDEIRFSLTNEIKDEINEDVKNGTANGTYEDDAGNYAMVSTNGKAKKNK